jgi:polar amino acid transport system ATP-binding protein
MIKIDHVHKKIGDNIVLNDISLSVQKNSIVGLAGPSGSGKSTLLRCLQGLETIDTGAITCNGSTGFMFQEFQLFPHMTVLQNLTYAPALHDKTADYQAHATRMLENLGIADKSAAYPHELSGGQKQRVALARSLMMQPEILLCDEPTSGLDIATTTDVVSLLESIRNKGVTMLIASHDLDFLTKIADRIVIIRAGKTVLDVTTKELHDPINFLKKYY